MTNSNCLTNYRGAGRIYHYFKANPNSAFEVKTIAEETKIKKDCCYTYLSRLASQGKLDRVRCGLYRFRQVAKLEIRDDESPILLHHIHLTRKETDPPLQLTHSNNVSNSPAVGLDNKRTFRHDLSNDRKVEVKVSASIEIAISCTKNPLTLSELGLLLDLLECVYSLDLSSAGDLWLVSSIEINVDVFGCRIDGCSSFTFTEFKNVSQRFYNKDRRLRIETIVSSPNIIPFSELLLFLKGRGQIGVADLRERVKSLEGAIRMLARESKLQRKVHDKLLLTIHEMKKMEGK